MLKKIVIYVGFATLALIGPSSAQIAAQPNKAEDHSANAQPGQATLSEIVTWLSLNFDFPAIYDPPRVEFVPARKLADIRYKAFLSRAPGNVGVDPAAHDTLQRDTIAVYDDQTSTIFVSDAWSGSTPAEQSVLVHETVHHLQNLGKIKYECPAAREKPAYLAQDQWLKRFGTDLETAFELDLFTILVKSSCMF
jgi:hypothetical protein